MPAHCRGPRTRAWVFESIPDAAVIHVVATPLRSTNAEAQPETAALSARFVAACSEAARPRRCALVAEDDGQGSTATVVFTSEHSARVDMRDEAGRHSVRDVSFRVEDPVEDRWQTIALLVASLDGEQRAAVPPAPPPSRDGRTPRTLWLTLLGEGGDGVEPGPPRFGGSARIAFRPRGFVGYFTAGAGYSSSVRTADGIRPTWVPLSLGAGAVIEFDSTRLVLRPRLDLVMERQGATITGATVGEGPTSGSRWLPGLGVSFDLAVPTPSPLSIVFGGNALFTDGSTAIRLGRERVASFPAHSYGVHVGVDIALDALFGLAGD